MGVFQTNIEWLLKSHNLLEEFQTQEHFHVRFTMPGFDRLVIERHGELISVAHYFEQEGDLIADPEVELHFPTWYPTAITQAWLGRREKFFEQDDKKYVDLTFHGEVTSFLTLWGRNIRSQGWDKANSSTPATAAVEVEG